MKIDIAIKEVPRTCTDTLPSVYEFTLKGTGSREDVDEMVDFILSNFKKNLTPPVDSV